MLGKFKKATIVLLVMSLILIQFSNIIYAINENINTMAWNTEENQKATLGLSFQQLDQKYYKILYSKNGSETNTSRAVYRTYFKDGNSSKDYSKNIFCLDIDGKFPSETSTESVASEDGTATYKSKGELNSSTGSVTLTNSKTLNNGDLQKVLAIINSGYNYSTFESNTKGLEEWLDKVIA